MRHISLILISLLMVGCTSNPSREAPSHLTSQSDRVLILDNSGGYSHPGRRIELLRDGRVLETRYTDVIGHANRNGGTYQLADGVLDLRFGDRGNQRLLRVAYDGDIYWVYPNEADDIRKPENARLRQTSLKQKGEPDGTANGSQPIRSETNRTSSAAGSRR
jgi:hypothetical protein